MSACGCVPQSDCWTFILTLFPSQIAIMAVNLVNMALKISGQRGLSLTMNQLPCSAMQSQWRSRHLSTRSEAQIYPQTEPVRQVFISQSTDIFTNLALEDWLYRHHDFKRKVFPILKTTKKIGMLRVALPVSFSIFFCCGVTSLVWWSADIRIHGLNPMCHISGVRTWTWPDEIVAVELCFMIWETSIAPSLPKGPNIIASITWTWSVPPSEDWPI